MAKYSENPITSSDINWNENDPSNGLPWSGKSIREFQKLKNKETENNTATKVGASYFDSATMTLYNFINEEAKDAWLNGGGDSFVLGTVPFNFSGTLTQIVLTNRLNDTNIYFTTTATEAILSIGIVSQRKGITDPSWQDINEDFYVSVDLDKGSTGKYESILKDEFVLNGKDFSFDSRKYLATGSNRVRITVRGVDTGTTKNIVYTVNLTTMYLSASKFAWNEAFIEGTNYSLGGMNIGGNLNKTLKIRVKNETLGYDKTYEKSLGSATYITSAYYYGDLKFPETGTGVYNVDIWLDANGLESDHLNYNIAFVSATDINTAKLVVLNEVPKVALNYTEAILFNYSIYNGGATTGNPQIKVSFGVESIIDETLSNVSAGTIQKYSSPLEIETERSDGNLDIEVIFGNTVISSIILDNSASYPALPDAKFYLNAASRSNSQSNRLSIVNNIDQAEIPATWSGMTFVDGLDGWTDDGEGRDCLLLPAGASVEVDYKPLGAFAGKGKTIELSFKVKNIADYDEPIITMATEGESWKGIKIYPKKILLRSNLLKDDKSQSYPLKDEELVHIVVTVIRDYKNYGNIAQIYVNGGTRCSFSFTTSDDFSAASNLIMGSESSDIYLYKMRIYDQGFEWPGVVQNFINCLPGAQEKVAVWKKMNDILDDSYNISYDSIKDTYNTMVIEMLGDSVLPDLLNPAGGQCNLNIDIKDIIDSEVDSDFSKLLKGQDILNQTIEGQGTTAMTYFRWNFRWKLDKTYNKRRITAKKNVASSMHSHKMGATRMYNDLHREILGQNEASGRVAVYQYPVFAFTKTLNELGEWNYDFIGLYTVGPDKGDKTTFGYDSSAYKTSVMHMEGTDHTPMAVGMDYPWSELRYSSAKEGFGAISKSGDVATAWEVGMAGELEPDSSSDEAAVMSMVVSEFKPAYEVAYKNSPFILGVTETISQINAQKVEWRKKKTPAGKAYSELEFWTDGEYILYYWNIQEETYKSTGINLLTDLGISIDTLSSMTLEEKNNYIIEARKDRFARDWGNYWNTQDAIFCYTFLMIFAATDNFKKNSYPYKFAPLSSGGRWRWRQDDLDTLADINNQGFSSKEFSVLVGDTTSSGSVFRGDNSVFWSLVGLTQGDEIKKMVHSIFDTMAAMSPTGQSTLEKINGYVKHCMWDFAQNYFPESAYNIDAGWTYEEAWKLKIDGKYNNDVDPLGQSLGSHFEAEKDWFELRTLFIAAYYNYGPFSTDNGDDTSTGQISFRASSGRTYNITPAIDFNPTILIGQSDLTTAGERIKAGDSVSIVVPDMGNNDTHVYIQGADWYSDLGDLKDLAVSTDNPVFTISSKRLRTLKLGDAVSSSVTSNIKTLNIGSCPSLEEIDARNLPELSGTVDLSKCPRLRKALFKGTKATEINLKPGCKASEISFPDTLATLSLINLPNIVESGIDLGTLQAVTYLRIEGCENLNAFGILEACIDNGVLKNIRLTGIDKEDGEYSDLELLGRLVEDGYFGIESDGSINDTRIPVLEGYIKINGKAYEDVYNNLKEAYGEKLVIEITGGYYVRFQDPEVQRIVVSNWGDGTGITTEQVKAITDIGTKFSGNTLIETFDEFEKFEGVTALKSNGGFYGCSNLASIKFPVSLVTINSNSISSNFITEINLPNLLNWYGFCNLPALEKITLQKLKSTDDAGLFLKHTAIKEVHLPSCTIIGKNTFNGCTSLQVLELPFENITAIGQDGFNSVQCLDELKLSSLQTIGAQGFRESSVREITDLGDVTVIDWATFHKCHLLESIPLEKITNFGNNAFYTCPSLNQIVLGENITQMGSMVFRDCTSLQHVIIKALNPPSMGGSSFMNTNNCPIYVPDASVEAYQSATNWITYKDRIKSIFYYLGYIDFVDPAVRDICVANFDTDGDGKVSMEEAAAVTDIGTLFQGNTSITSFNEFKYFTGVTSVASQTWNDCRNLSSITFPNSITTLNRNIMANSIIESVVVPENVTYADRVFENCNKLQTITINTNMNWNNISWGSYSVSQYILSNVTNYIEREGCIYTSDGLKFVAIPPKKTELPSTWAEGVTALETYCFMGNKFGSAIEIPENITDINLAFVQSNITKTTIHSIFRQQDMLFNSPLKVIEITKAQTLSASSFRYANALSSLILLDTSISPLTGSFSNNPIAYGTGYIYVPDDLVDSYKAATNWNAYASQIKPLSEYVES